MNEAVMVVAVTIGCVLGAGCGVPALPDGAPDLERGSEGCVKVFGALDSLDEPEGFSCLDVRDKPAGTYFCSLVVLTGDLEGCGEYTEYGGAYVPPNNYAYVGTTRLRLGEVTIAEVDGGEDCREDDDPRPVLYLDEESLFNEDSLTYAGYVTLRNADGDAVGELVWSGRVGNVGRGTYRGEYCP